MVLKFQHSKLLTTFLSLSIVLGMLPVFCISAKASTPSLSFNDLDGYEWADPALSVLKAAGIVNGTSETTFNPSSAVPRAGFAKVLCSAFNLRDSLYANAPSSFSDVGTSEYSMLNKCIEAAKGYFYCPDTNSDGKGEFNPAGALTREEIVYALVNVLGLDTSGVDQTAAAQKYSVDWASVGDTYKPAVALATEMGFVSGNGNGSFNPTAPVNRAEMAVLIYRALMSGGGVGKGNIFDDIKPGDWYYNSVMNLYNRGVISGTDIDSDNIFEFQPNSSVTNEELNGLLNKRCNNSIPAGTLPVSFASNSSPATREVVIYAYAKMTSLAIPADVNSVLSQYTDQASITESYRDQIAAASVAGIKGYYNADNLVFDPQGTVTNAELAVLLEKTLPSNVVGQVFFDLAPSNWCYDGVMNLDPYQACRTRRKEIK